MVFFAWSKNGIAAFESLWCDNCKCHLWVSGGVLTREEMTKLRAIGMQISEFSATIVPTQAQVMADAMTVIREHHPDESIWIESSC